ncbi:unnamed protein product [Rotaria magnacalcarata]|uniref:Uncharacterized protein n=1 Tax=Rotaria magnacalcarata TaxID=392030 RepID=A0A8S3EZL5_9BILA|nr:unnamed protein product [Rotaria magnacalcarata]
MIDADVSLYLSIERFKDSRVIDEISKKVKDILEKQGRTTRTSSIIKASKNIDSLLLSKRKGTALTFLSVYPSVNVAESLNHTVVATVFSDENALETGVGDDDDSINSDSSRPFSPSTSHDSLSSDISFYMCNDIMKTNARFKYLLDYFKHSLSMNNKPMNLEKIVTDLCAYVFLELIFSVNIRILKIEISLQLTHLVQSALTCATFAGEGVIEVLVTTNNFSLVFKSISSLAHFQLSMKY